MLGRWPATAISGCLQCHDCQSCQQATWTVENQTEGTHQLVCMLGGLKVVSGLGQESQVLCTLSSRTLLGSPKPLVDDLSKLREAFALLGVKL